MQGKDKEVIIWWDTRAMARGGYRIGKCLNGVYVCGSHFASRFIVGVRRMAVGQWLMTWTGEDPEDTETAHRCPEASGSQDPVAPTNVWSNYRSTQPAQEAASPSLPAQDSGASAADQAKALDENKSSVVAEWSEPTELRPCSDLVLHPDQLMSSGVLCLEDTVEDTLEALKEMERDANKDHEDEFIPLEGDALLPPWENWVDELTAGTKLAAPLDGAVSNVSGSSSPRDRKAATD